LSDGGNLSGAGTATLAISAATTNNSGSYQMVASNLTGYATSRPAVLKVGYAPAVSVSPPGLTLLAGSTAVFTATPGGSPPFGYLWKKNGINFSGTGISGTTSNVLVLADITTNSAANYAVVVTNLFGTVTSAAAPLTVVLPPSFTGSVTNRTIQCGSNTNLFAITTVGTGPLSTQWSLDGTAVPGATNSSFSLTNLFQPNHTVAVVVTNLYGIVMSNALLTVQDTSSPVITLIGGSRLTNELGSAFTDPGATAYDACAGTLAVITSGIVSVNAVGTNTLAYNAADGNGNTNTATRTVVVRDTTPPAISWSFTNLVLTANSSCVAAMPDATGTNYILATDLSGTVVITQSPTNNALLQPGTNTVVITVADASGNKSYSTNRIAVLDQAPPVIWSQPVGRTNVAGTGASFTVAATACTTVFYQWYFDNAALAAQTNLTLAFSNVGLTNAGNYFAVATAAGGSSTSAAVQLVVYVPSTLVLASSTNPSGFKDSLVFMAAVTPTNATGSVQFFTNGAAFYLGPLVAGAAASTNTEALPRGTNLITAVYFGDTSDLPSTNSLAQIVTNHPPVVQPASYTLVAGLDLDIAVTDLATNWGDPDGDPLFIASIGMSTNGVVVANGVPTLFYSNPNYLDDQFVCVISDGFGGTNFQAVTIIILPQTNTAPAISALAVHPPGGVSLGLEGGYGSTYVLESTADFLSGNWSPVATNKLGIDGRWLFTDPEAASQPQRFYRLRLMQ